MGGYAVTDRMLKMFKSGKETPSPSQGAGAMRDNLIQASYLIAALLFILGLRRMSSPKTARGGILWAGGGMVLATVATFFWPHLSNYLLIVIAIVVGGGISLVLGQRVAHDRHAPDDRALQRHGRRRRRRHLRGRAAERRAPATTWWCWPCSGGIIGTVSFSGCLIAFAKLQGLIKKSVLFPGQNVVNMIVLAARSGGGRLRDRRRRRGLDHRCCSSSPSSSAS